MQPCGLRDLAHPWERRSFGLKTKRFAGYARGTLTKRALKKRSCNPAGCGIWRALGGDFRLASRPFGSRIGPAVPLAQRGLKNIHATLRTAGFGAPLGATVVWPQSQTGCGLHPRHLGRKGAKKQSCNLAGCENGRVLGGYGRLVSRSSQLRAAPATGEPKEVRFGA